jgi:hypothetical protein
MKELYFLSGLGADKRVFDFLDLEGYEINHIQWINPEDNESIEAYARRLLPQIKTSKPVLIGVSFGGMMAVEIGKLIETEKNILISSARTADDLAFYYRLIGKLNIHRLIPASILKSVNPVMLWLFGITSPDEKKLMKSIMKETDTRFLKWAIEKIVTWENRTIPLNTVTIHGTNDKLIANKKADYELEAEGHLMILNKGRIISNVIRTILN